MLNRMMGILENLVVFEDRMKSNIYLTNGVDIRAARHECPYRERFRARTGLRHGAACGDAGDGYRCGISGSAQTERSGDGCTLQREELDACFTLEYYYEER